MFCTPAYECSKNLRSNQNGKVLLASTFRALQKQRRNLLFCNTNLLYWFWAQCRVKRYVGWQTMRQRNSFPLPLKKIIHLIKSGKNFEYSPLRRSKDCKKANLTWFLLVVFRTTSGDSLEFTNISRNICQGCGFVQAGRILQLSLEWWKEIRNARPSRGAGSSENVMTSLHSRNKTKSFAFCQRQYTFTSVLQRLVSTFPRTERWLPQSCTKIRLCIHVHI